MTAVAIICLAMALCMCMVLLLIQQRLNRIRSEMDNHLIAWLRCQKEINRATARALDALVLDAELRAVMDGGGHDDDA